jgi:acyl-CoA thioesterase I
LQNAPRRPTTQRRAAPAAPGRPPRAIIIGAAALVLVALFWFLRPSPLADVLNLSSRGTSIIAFGDSITAGYGASAGSDYPAHLSRITGLPVINAGVSGDTTESALARLESDVLSRDPRIVIVGLGGNDFLRGVEILSTEAMLRSIVRRIQEAGAIVVLLGYNFPSRGGNYEAMYERVAEEEGCLLVPNTLKGILSDPALKSDQIHPNDRGYELIGRRVAGPLQKLVSKADAARR